MDVIKINERILESISEKTRGDKVLRKFINEMLYEELEHPGQWWFKDTYRKKIKEYSQKWGEKSED